jgi:hypothetical protein
MRIRGAMALNSDKGVSRNPLRHMVRVLPPRKGAGPSTDLATIRLPNPRHLSTFGINRRVDKWNIPK